MDEVSIPKLDGAITMRRRGKKPSRVVACAGKEKLTKAQAIAQVNRRRKKGEYLNAYRCREVDCRLSNGIRSWHVGRPPQF